MRRADERFRAWTAAAVFAVLGWLLGTLLLVVGVPLTWWAASGVAVLVVAVATLYARARDAQPLEVAGFTFAAMVLSWPILAVVTLAVAGLLGGSAGD